MTASANGKSATAYETIIVGKKLILDKVVVTGISFNDPATQQPWDPADRPDLQFLYSKPNASSHSGIHPFNDVKALDLPLTMTSGQEFMAPVECILFESDNDISTLYTMIKKRF